MSNRDPVSTELLSSSSTSSGSKWLNVSRRNLSLPSRCHRSIHRKQKQPNTTDTMRMPALRASPMVCCNVYFLDGTHQSFQIDKNSKGECLFELVTDHIDLQEKDYFGLQIKSIHNEFCMRKWLDSQRSIKKQVKHANYQFELCVRFYPEDPDLIIDEYSRLLIFLQLQRDMREGFLLVPESKSALLCSYIVQSDAGDYNSKDHGSNYLQRFRFLPNPAPDLYMKVHDLHIRHSGKTPADAELLFLKDAKTLDTYGFHPFRARKEHVLNNEDDEELLIGVNHAGIKVFLPYNPKAVERYSWANIIKISFKRKHFLIEAQDDIEESEEKTNDFLLESSRACKQLWKKCVDNHTFFRLRVPLQPPPKLLGLLSFGSRFRYSRRTQLQCNGKPSDVSQQNSIMARSFFSRSAQNVFRQTFDSPSPSGKENNPKHERSSGVFRRNNNYQCRHAYMNGELDADDSGNADSQLPTTTTTPQSWSSRLADKIRFSELFKRDPSSRDTSNHFSDSQIPLRTRFAPHSSPNQTHIPHPNNKYPNGVSATSTQGVKTTNSPSNQQNALKNEKSLGRLESFKVKLAPLRIADTKLIENGCDFGPLVSVRLKPDVQGKFGFNVKGGCDIKSPVIVTRVTSNSSADIAEPALREGDEIIQINGKSVMDLTHIEVVKLIQGGYKDPRSSGYLELIVRPDTFYDPVSTKNSTPNPPRPSPPQPMPHYAATLAGSMALLRESLSNGLAIQQFEMLPKRNAVMSMNDANNNKMRNRYCDVLPYDDTRVRLRALECDNASTTSSGALSLIMEEEEDTRNFSISKQVVENCDYINANYVKMRIPGSGVVNHYIASQGPLTSTFYDFWRMVWQEESNLIVMLTQLRENNRVKCDWYWPALHEARDYGMLQVTCVSENCGSAFSLREFSLVHMEKGEERRVTHMQYSAWPDHGVPSHDSIHFLNFVQQVRVRRAAQVAPTVIHCSAGIGRTGVLILMETAMCLIEANEPVYPIKITQNMRDQRGMLIQTGEQYKFVLNSILRAYDEKLVKPLIEYTRQAQQQLGRCSASSSNSCLGAPPNVRHDTPPNIDEQLHQHHDSLDEQRGNVASSSSCGVAAAAAKLANDNSFNCDEENIRIKSNCVHNHSKQSLEFSSHLSRSPASDKSNDADTASTYDNTDELMLSNSSLPNSPIQSMPKNANSWLSDISPPVS